MRKFVAIALLGLVLSTPAYASDSSEFFSNFVRIFTRPVNCAANWTGAVVPVVLDASAEFGRCVIGNTVATMNGAADTISDNTIL